MERPASSLSMQSSGSSSRAPTLIDGDRGGEQRQNDEMYLPTQLGPRPRSRKGGGTGQRSASISSASITGSVLDAQVAPAPEGQTDSKHIDKEEDVVGAIAGNGHAAGGGQDGDVAAPSNEEKGPNAEALAENSGEESRRVGTRDADEGGDGLVKKEAAEEAGTNESAQPEGAKTAEATEAPETAATSDAPKEVEAVEGADAAKDAEAPGMTEAVKEAQETKPAEPAGPAETAEATKATMAAETAATTEAEKATPLYAASQQEKGKAKEEQAEANRSRSPSPPPVPPKSPRHLPQETLRYTLPIGGYSRPSLLLSRSSSSVHPRATAPSIKSSNSSVAINSQHAGPSSSSSSKQARVASLSSVSLPSASASRPAPVTVSSSSSLLSITPALAPALALTLAAPDEVAEVDETSAAAALIARTPSASSNRTARPGDATPSAVPEPGEGVEMADKAPSSMLQLVDLRPDGQALTAPSSTDRLDEQATTDSLQRPKLARPKSTGNLEVDSDMASQRRPLVKTRPHAKSLLMVDGQMFLLDGEEESREPSASQKANGDSQQAADAIASSRDRGQQDEAETGRQRERTMDSSEDSNASAGFSEWKRGHPHDSTGPSSLGSDALLIASSSSTKLAQAQPQPQAQLQKQATQAREAAGEHGDTDNEEHDDYFDANEVQQDDDDDDAPPGAYAIHPPSRARLAEAAKLPLYDAEGRVCQFGDIFIRQRTLVVFLRHWFCPFCQMFSQSIQHIDPLPLQRANLGLVVVGQGHWHVTKSYMDVMNVPKWVKAYSDPSRNIYTALGMTLRTNDMGPASTRPDYQTKSMLKASLSAMKKGVFDMPLRPPGDLKLLGGEFILGPGLQCSFTHRMVTTRGHLDLPRILVQAGCDLSLKSAKAVGEEDGESSRGAAQSTRSADRTQARRLGAGLRFPSRKKMQQLQQQQRQREARPALMSSESVQDFNASVDGGHERNFSLSRGARTLPIKSVFRSRPPTAGTTASSSSRMSGAGGRFRTKSTSSAAAIAAAARSRDTHAKSASNGAEPEDEAVTMMSPRTEIVEIRPTSSSNAAMGTTERLASKARLALPFSWSKAAAPRDLDVTLRSRRAVSSGNAHLGGTPGQPSFPVDSQTRPTSSASTTAARDTVRPPLPTSSSSQAYLSAAARFHLSPNRPKRNPTNAASHSQSLVGMHRNSRNGLSDRSKSMANLSDLPTGFVTRIDDETFNVSKTGGISSLSVLNKKASKSVSSLKDVQSLRPFHTSAVPVSRSKSQTTRAGGPSGREDIRLRPATTPATTTSTITSDNNKGLGIDDVPDFDERDRASFEEAADPPARKKASNDVAVTLPFRQHAHRRQTSTSSLPTSASEGHEAAEASSSTSPVVPLPPQPPAPQVQAAMSAALNAAKKSSAMGGVPLSLFEKRILTSGHRFEDTSPRAARDSSPSFPTATSSPAAAAPSSPSAANGSVNSEAPAAKVPLSQQIRTGRMFDNLGEDTDYKRLDRRQLEPVSPPRMTPSPEPMQMLRMVEPVPVSQARQEPPAPARATTTDGPGPNGATPLADVVRAEDARPAHQEKKERGVESEVQQLGPSAVLQSESRDAGHVDAPRPQPQEEDEVKEELSGMEEDEDFDEDETDEEGRQLAKELQTAEVMERRVESLPASPVAKKGLPRHDHGPSALADPVLPPLGFGGSAGGGGSFLDDLEVIDGFQRRAGGGTDSSDARSRTMTSSSSDSSPEYDDDEDEDAEGYAGDYAPIRASNSAPIVSSSGKRQTSTNGHSSRLSSNDEEEAYSDDEEVYRTRSRQGRSASQDYYSDEDDVVSSRSTPSPSMKRPSTAPASSNATSAKTAASQRYNRTTKNRIGGMGNHHLYKPSSMTRIAGGGSRPLSAFLEEEEEDVEDAQAGPGTPKGRTAALP